jgi:Uma2 family endonuclease
MAAILPLALDLATLDRVVVRPGPEFTEDDFFEFCQEQHSLLRIERNSEGEIIIMAPAGMESGFIELEVAAQLREWAQKDRQGIVLGATAGLTLPDKSVLSPDASWIPMGRLKTLSRKQRQKFPPLVPAFVIEIRSPSDRKKDLQEKMQTYLRNKVELGWLIDPQSRTVSIYSSDRERPNELIDPERVFGEGPVAGFVLQLKQIYDQL